MKVNVDEVLYALDGKPLEGPSSPSSGEPVPLTLRLVAIRALLDPTAAIKREGAEKYRLFDLSRRVYRGGAVEMAVEEVALLKDVISMTFPPLIVGRVWDILEGKGGEDESK